MKKDEIIGLLGVSIRQVWNWIVQYLRWSLQRGSWWGKGLAFGSPALLFLLVIVAVFDGGNNDDRGAQVTALTKPTIVSVETASAETIVASPVPPPSIPLAPYIEGLTAEAALAAIKTRPGMDCTGPTRESALGKTELYWDCALKGPNVYVYRVTIIGNSPTEIKAIQAEFVNYSTLSTKAIAPQFLNPVAMLLYKDADPNRVKDWLFSSLGKADSDLTVGSAYFGLAASGNYVLLVIRSRAAQGE